MPWFLSDKFLWATIILGAGVAFVYVPEIIEYVADITLTPEPPETGPHKQLQRDAEKALSHDTLRTLSDGHSHDVRAATIKIVANRAINSRTKKLILDDIESKDDDRRFQAICALKLLFYNPVLLDKELKSFFVDTRSLTAIVNALCNLLEQHDPPPGGKVSASNFPSPLFPLQRPAHERLLLPIIKHILNTSDNSSLSEQGATIDRAYRAGLVSRWLARYPFPCCLPDIPNNKLRKSDVLTLFEMRRWAEEDPEMADIFNIIIHSSQGFSELRSAGLCVLDDPRPLSGSNSPDFGGDTRMINGESTAGALTPPEFRELLERTRDEETYGQPSHFSQEDEDSRRRRRREAVVVAEAGAPLRRENILQRTSSRTLAPVTAAEDTSQRVGNTMAVDVAGILNQFDSIDPSFIGRAFDIRPSTQSADATEIRTSDHPNRRSSQSQHEEDQLSFRRDRENQERARQIMEEAFLARPPTAADLPWDIRRQEIEGEAIINEAIRGAAAAPENATNNIRRRSRGDDDNAGTDRSGCIDLEDESS